MKNSLFSLVAIAICILFASIIAGFALGSKDISLTNTYSAFSQFDPQNNDHLLVYHLRVPRTLIAALSGAALAVAGLLMQSLTRNPMADAGVLGINAGASLLIVLFIATTGISAIHWHMAAGFMGALFSVLLVTWLGTLGRNYSPLRIILAGVAFSAVFLALTQLVILNSDEQVFDQFRHWSVGSVAGRDFNVFWPLAVLSVIAIVFSLLLSRSLDALCLGNELAKAVGVKTEYVWLMTLLVITLLAGSATAAVGPIAFIGLIVPHIVRALSVQNHWQLIILASLGGAAILVLADVVGRVIFSPAEVSAGIIMTLLGGPCFIYLAQQKRIKEL
ncbi:iron ABC transporter permease [Pseudoalteromonas sp. CO302Y]|uniref:FecCD family ABC transporter permease n=1 Tax=unclassified Pseudoalteromonas TaxID=194690 RepID=UPI001022F6FC|nr:iron ABC transporter permease [Pseudoalteromonas sp. CO302Y]RZG05938.1 iron ABC transporter permease [Pseudoalteromonas sp. CO133X]